MDTMGRPLFPFVSIYHPQPLELDDLPEAFRPVPKFLGWRSGVRAAETGRGTALPCLAISRPLCSTIDKDHVDGVITVAEQ